MSLRLMSRLVGRVGQRRALVMLDQGLSSLSNVVVTIAVARLLSPAQFGAFAVAQVAFQLTLAGVRSVVGEPWLSVYSAAARDERSQAEGDVVRAAFAAGAAVSLVIAVGAVALGGGVTQGALVALALVFPPLATQDALRYVAVVDRPQVAVASDLTWLVAAIALLVVAPENASPAWFVAAWGGAGIAGLLVSLAMSAVPVLSGSASRWFRQHRTMVGAFLTETLSARAAAHIVLLGLGGIAGLGAVGAVRAAQVFYGPLFTLFAGTYLALVPEGVRRRQTPHRLLGLMTLASLALASVAATWTVVGQLLPDSWGTALFGDTWARAQDVLLPIGLAFIAGAVTAGAFDGIRSLAQAGLSLRARLWSLPAQPAGALTGALVAGTVGYATGFAIGNVVVAVIWWSFFTAAIRRREAKHFAPDGRAPKRFVIDGVAAKHAPVEVTTGSSG